MVSYCENITKIILLISSYCLKCRYKNTNKRGGIFYENQETMVGCNFSCHDAEPSDIFTANPVTEKISSTQITAEAAGTMRRPCSPDNPMLIVHIDTWNYADPAKIIALIPEDIKPYVVFNISMSINWSNDSHSWLMVQDGYECAKSWLRICADERVWCMVQPASGGQCHLPDYDSSGNIVNFPNKSKFVQKADDDYENTIYAEFFRDYPNFIGFNYSEQFWGFESNDFPVTPVQRYEHFAKLLKLCNKYGGYLNINWCANQWSAPLNPVAMLKRCPEWRTSCENYSQNLQLEEKYTQASYIEDVESEVLGAYLSGYCGNFGVRYDETGWTDSTWSGTGVSTKDQYRQITGLPIHLERMAFNGATVIDGPELVWADDFKETWGGVKDSDGYTCRNWEMHDQYVNATLDFFRKVIDGTIRIPTRQEVIDRTKVVIIQDVSSGDDNSKYSTYPTLFEGLYRMPNDGNLKDNHNLYKSTGRYPTIPTVYTLRDSVAKSFQVQIKQSQIASRWATISAKQDEFNKGDASLRLRQIIGNAIAAGEAEDMIVVFPDIYASDTQDKCDGLDARNNAAYDNFINLLVKEIMPYMEQNYSIKTGRDNTAITGFSMGGRESLNIGFTRPDLFGYVGAMCPAPGLMDDQIPAENLKFTSNNPYMLFISAGSNDTLIWSTPAGYHDTLNTNGVTHIWHYVTGGDHGGKTIRPHMYNFIRHVFKAS